jgi:hypothetical protein
MKRREPQELGLSSFHIFECRTRTSEAGTAQDARGDFQRQDAAAGNPFESSIRPYAMFKWCAANAMSAKCHPYGMAPCYKVRAASSGAGLRSRRRTEVAALRDPGT